jgi:hypothetical protein
MTLLLSFEVAGSLRPSLTIGGSGGKAELNTYPLQPAPNLSILKAMAAVAEIQKGMEPKPGKDSVEYLREGREGEMYGCGTEQ